MTIGSKVVTQTGNIKSKQMQKIAASQHGKKNYVAVTAQKKRMFKTRMWANAQPDGRPAEHRWRPLFNAAKFG